MSEIVVKNEDKDPWKDKGHKDEADALDESIARFRAKFKRMFSGGGHSHESHEKNQRSDGFGFIFLAVIGLIIAIWVLSGIYIVKPAEKAVIVRFGKYSETVGPGPHWLPRFIENEYIVNEQHIDSYQYSHDMLTEDENLVDVSVVVQYRIANARDYLFNVVTPVVSLQQATASALRQVIGDMTLGDILATGREKVRDRVATQLNHILSLYHTGLEVTEVALQPAMPPKQVRGAFDDVINAMEDEQRFNNEAQAQALKLEQEAKGQANGILNAANAFRDQVVLQSRAKTAGFLATLPLFEKAPEVTRERMYMDAIQSVLDKSTKLILDVGNKGNSMFYLPLDKILKNESLGQHVMSAASKEAAHKNTTPDQDDTPNYSNNYVERGMLTARPQRPWNISVASNRSERSR